MRRTRAPSEQLVQTAGLEVAVAFGIEVIGAFKQPILTVIANESCRTCTFVGIVGATSSTFAVEATD